jgi:hypothetical protein
MSDTLDPPRPVNRSGEELAMRAIVVAALRREYPDARIIHELPLRYSTNRIDIAAVTHKEIISVEIKSSNDVIDRLERQVRTFAQISSRLIVALAPKWNVELPPKRVTRAGSYDASVSQYTETQDLLRKIGEPHVETWTCDAATGLFERTNGGFSRFNPHPWSWRMLHLLHVAELWTVADRHKVPVFGRNPTHASYVESCSSYMSGRDVCRAVCRALRERAAFGAMSDPPIAPPQSTQTNLISGAA